MNKLFNREDIEQTVSNLFPNKNGSQLDYLSNLLHFELYNLYRATRIK